MTEQLPLLRFATLLRIAHHIPGRVRLKLAAEGTSELVDMIDQVRQFIRSITDTPGIRSVNLNPAARSCVVEYDPALIPPFTWQDLVSGTDSAAVKELVQAVAGFGRARAPS